jgi:uncharacterized C2H2 Zn-finger protein
MPRTVEVVPDELRCPKCGAVEMHPSPPDRLTIRAYKVYDADGTAWSQCLVCSGYYDSEGNETPNGHDSKKGWFAT